jgi:hypothetical protein
MTLASLPENRAIGFELVLGARMATCDTDGMCLVEIGQTHAVIIYRALSVTSRPVFPVDPCSFLITSITPRAGAIAGIPQGLTECDCDQPSPS